jgi:glyoxylase-like metal-dependent hydrolase (beta-lactamase superfamily II)
VGVVTIPLPVPLAVGVVNCYLLEGKPLTLVDPGLVWDETIVELEAALARRGLQVEDVEQVLLTHQHLDHVGLAGTIRERSGAQVVAHRQLGPFLIGLPESTMDTEDLYQAEVMRLHGVPDAIIESLYETSKAHRLYATSVTADQLVGEGDVVRAGGRDLVVHERPGHSPSDLIFVDEADRLALLGDHLIGHISSNPVIHRPLGRPADPHRREPALIQYIDSLRKTAALDLETMLPGHGNPVEDHRALVDERIEFHGRRKQRIMDGLGSELRTAHELARNLWGVVAEREAFLTLSEALGHLDLLEAEGRVHVVDGADGLLRYEPTAK